MAVAEPARGRMLVERVCGLTMEQRVVTENSGDSCPITILYVDDDPDLLSIGRRFLERLGSYRVESAQSALEALAHLKRSSVDLVLSDYQMPDMDGITFLKEIRSSYGDLPFILFTGRGREEVVIEALNSGADFYLQKGGDPRSQFVELDYTIRQAVTRRRVLRQASSFDRFNTMLSRISAAARDALTRDLFLQECCRSTVDTGLIHSAWIGWMEKDTVEIELLAYAPDECEALFRTSPYLFEDVGLKGACRQAWSTGTIQTCISNHLLTRIYPLFVFGRCAGVFVVSQKTGDMSADEEASLLERVAQEISSAIDRFERASDLARMKEILADWQVRFRLLADHSPLGFLTLDPTGRVVEMNKASTDLLGRTLDQVIDHPFVQFLSPGCQPFLSQLLRDSAYPLGDRRLRLHLICGDSSTLEVEITCEASSGPDGRLLGVHCLLHPLDRAVIQTSIDFR